VEAVREVEGECGEHDHDEKNHLGHHTMVTCAQITLDQWVTFR
jgi:hypothetical protein